MRPSVLLPLGLLLSRGQAAPTNTRSVRLASRDIPYGVILTHCTVPGAVALTFDDGPYIYTSHVLDLLDQVGAKATFFINGDNYVGPIDDESQPWPDLLRRMVSSGHQIGSHTWSHVDLTAADSATRYYQMHQLEVTLSNILGIYPTYMRPPYAACEGACLSDLDQMGYHIINYDIDTKDYENDSPDLIANAMNTFSNGLASGGNLVLSHDVHQQTALTLVPFMLQTVQQYGLRPVTVGECMGDPEENWYKDA